MSELSKWFAWTYSSGKQRKVLEFVSDLVDIEDFMCPMCEKDYKTKNGTRVKKLPVFDNYIFLKYRHSNQLFSTIKDFQWMSNFIGSCTDEEIKRVGTFNNKRYRDVESIVLEPGMEVRMIDTPFKDMYAVIVEVDGERLVVSIRLFSDERLVKCSTKDVEAHL
jgi:transcription antitermination factor NusG